MSVGAKLSEIIADLSGVWLESGLMLGAILILIIGLITNNKTVIKVLFLAILSFGFIIISNQQETGVLMLKSIFIDPMVVGYEWVFLMVAALILLFPRKSDHAAEFYFLMLSVVIGALFMVKANNLLMIYLSIELTSFASYILTNFGFKKRSFEAGIKYLMFGAISSAIMLLGLGLIYGTANGFYITDWSAVSFQSLGSQVGFFFTIIGLFFKISIVPAHIWVPATYQEAPTDAVALLSIVPKIAGILLLKRFFESAAFPDTDWVIQVTLLLGILTIVIGTLGAFRQSNVRRMISFGAIAHSGFLLPFALIHSETSDASLWYYTVTYAIMNVAVFLLLDSYERKKLVEIEAYSQSNDAWMGVLYTLVLVSLIGLPPLAGFTAKLFLFSMLFEASGLVLNSFMWYLIVALIATVGSLFFYFQIPRHLFLSKRDDSKSIHFDFSTKIMVTLFCIVLLLLFFVPQLVLEMQQMLIQRP